MLTLVISVHLSQQVLQVQLPLQLPLSHPWMPWLACKGPPLLSQVTFVAKVIEAQLWQVSNWQCSPMLVEHC